MVCKGIEREGKCSLDLFPVCCLVIVVNVNNRYFVHSDGNREIILGIQREKRGRNEGFLVGCKMRRRLR